MRRILFLSCIVLSLPSLTFAKPLVLACDIRESSHAGYRVVDQIVVDIDRQLIEYRVAKSMGTSWPQNWIFTNRSNDSMRIELEGPDLAAFAMKDGNPAVFEYRASGQFTHVQIGPTAVWWYIWDCRR